MELSNDTLYLIVRILFALSLLAFLFLVIRTTSKELQQPSTARRWGKQPTLRAELVVIGSEEQSAVAEGSLFEIQGVTTLGRGESARVVLEDSSVSALHAMLRPVDDRWAIEDLGSRNGTLVNERPVTGQVPLACGDALQLGRVRLRLLC